MGNFFVPDNFESITADAVVIGGGIVGAATAFWLSKAGMTVKLVEMRDALSTLTTAASVECFRTQFTEPAMAELSLESVDMLENFSDVVGIPDIDIGMTQRGYLFVTDEADMIPDLEAAVSTHHKLGVATSELITGDDLHKRFPFLAPQALAATFNRRDGWLSAHETTYGFGKGSDADFLLRTKALEIVTDAKGVCAVKTDRGTIHTRLVVNCSGPFAKPIAETAGLTLPLTTVRRQKVFITATADKVPQNAPFVVDLVNHAYWRPEAGGLLCAWVDPDEPVREPSEDLPIDWDFGAEAIYRTTRLNPFMEKIADDLKSEDIDVSAGMYVYTPDDQPIIGPSEIEGLHLNCGYWCGVMMSPAAGKRVADIATGNMDNKDNPLRFSRFKEGIAKKGDTFLK